MEAKVRERRWLLLPGLWALTLIACLLGAVLPPLAASSIGRPDYALQDTYYVVAHTGFVISFGLMLVIVTGVYLAVGFFRPGARRWLGVLHWLVTVVGLVLIFWPAYWLSLSHEPLRMADYPARLRTMNAISSAGYLVMLIGLAPFVAYLADAFILPILRKRRA
ncbi:MAG: cytochrome c oxidase, subunit [Caulobacter sp.]|nr:cytochrome c oxidase, subunit [Caulobacter sp.]